MADETTTIGIEADLSQLIAEMQRAEGMTAKQAASMVASLKKQIASAEKAAKASAGAAKKATDQAAKAAEQAAAKAAAVTKGKLGDIKQASGAVFGGIVNDVDDVAKGLMAVGPAGAVVVASLAAIAGTAYGVYKVAESIVSLSFSLEESNEKLEDYYARHAPGFTRASEDALDASRELNAAVVVFHDTITQTGVAVGDEFAPEVNRLSDDMVALTLIVNDASDAMLGSGKVAEALANTISTTFPKAAAAFELWEQASAGYREEAEKLTKVQAILAKVQDVNKDLAETAKQKTEEQAEAERKAAEAAREREKAEREKQKAMQASIDADLELMEIGQELWDEGVEEQRKAGEKMLADQEAAAAAELALAKEVADQKAAYSTMLAEQAIADAKKQAAAEKQAVNTSLALVDDLLQAKIDAAAEGSQQQKDEALVAFNIQKALTTSQIIVDGIRAVSTALATPPAPNLALGAVATAQYAALAIKAASAPPPTFKHRGGLAPDERSGLVTRNNEAAAVFTRQGLQAMGGEHGLARINRGEPPVQRVYVTQQYQHKAFGTFVQDNQAMTNSPLRKALKRGDRVGRRTR